MQAGTLQREPGVSELAALCTANALLLAILVDESSVTVDLG